MEVDFHRIFKKMYKKQPRKVQQKFIERLDLFKDDPFKPILNNHVLTGDLKMYRSINVTGDIRAWYEPRDDYVMFMKIGTHSQLHG